MQPEQTFVYLCRPGDNEELRYSLRSIDKFYPNATVWIIGGKPDWYRGNFIEVSQSFNKYENVRSALIKVCENDLIPNEIVVMNDDFFFVKHVDKIPNYISGSLRSRIIDNLSNNVSSIYIKKLNQLHNHCKQYKRLPLDFDLHVPMRVYKDKLSTIVKESVMWRSNYGNKFINDNDVKIIEDVKVYPDGQYAFKSYDYLSFKYPFFSTQDDSFEEVLNNILIDMFPYPSKYEFKNNDELQ